MIWKIEFDPLANKELSKLDPQIAKRILGFLYQRIAFAKDPRMIGEVLKGSKLGEFWKYRVGDYRIIVNIIDSEVKVLVIKIGNRKEVYR